MPAAAQQHTEDSCHQVVQMAQCIVVLLCIQRLWEVVGGFIGVGECVKCVLSDRGGAELSGTVTSHNPHYFKLTSNKGLNPVN